MQRRSLLLSLSMLSLGTALHAQSAADTGTLYIPFPAGGSSDVFGRILAPSLSRQLQRHLIVENLAGASGSIAARKVLSRGGGADALFLASPTETILAPATLKSAGYKPADFRMVGLISRVPLGVYVRADLPVQSIDELVAYARSRKDTPLSYGSVGMPMTHVPYKGGAPAQQDLMGGLVDIFMTPFGKSHGQLVDEGKLKVVGVLSAERQSMFKKAPTLNESKALKGFVFEMWSGYFVRKDTPEAVVHALHKALSEVANDPAVRAALEAQAMVVPRPQPLAAMNKVYADNMARYRGIAKAINLQPE